MINRLCLSDKTWSRRSVTAIAIIFCILGVIFGMAFFVSLTFLLFEGRRWRFIAHNTLVAILSLPTSAMGAPFNVFPRLVVILVGFPADLILNSFYQKFKKSNKLVYWSILTSLVFFSILPVFQHL